MANLYIVATPIGNLKDITIRALEVLFSVEYIACEDTRRTGLLLSTLKGKYADIYFVHNNSRSLHFMYNTKLISYYDQIEYKKMPEIIKLLKEGHDVALVSDGGTPLISDPGYKLIQECIKRGINITSIPGPSAVISSLVSSGLPANNFWFLGYLPTKTMQRKKLLSNLWQCLKTLPQKPTLIFFEAPHRIRESLKDMQEVCGDIEIVIAKELTKIHEEIWRGKVIDAQNKFINTQGEIVILLSTC